MQMMVIMVSNGIRQSQVNKKPTPPHFGLSFVFVVQIEIILFKSSMNPILIQKQVLTAKNAMRLMNL